MNVIIMGDLNARAERDHRRFSDYTAPMESRGYSTIKQGFIRILTMTS